MTIAQVLQCQEKQIIESKYNNSLLYTTHKVTNIVNVNSSLMTSVK